MTPLIISATLGLLWGVIFGWLLRDRKSDIDARAVDALQDHYDKRLAENSAELEKLRREREQFTADIKTLQFEITEWDAACGRANKLWRETMRANRELREEKQRMLDRIACLERPRDAKGRFAKR